MCDHSQVEYKKEELLLNTDEMNYKITIELSHPNIKVTAMMESLSPFKWNQQFSLEQLQKISNLFNACERLEDAYEGLKNILQSKDFSISVQEKAMIINVHFTSFFQKCQFDIELPQTDLDTAKAFDYRDEIESLKAALKQKDEEIHELKEVLSKLSLEQKLLNIQQKKFSQILFEPEVEMIGNWINKDKQVNLELIYRATTDGFDLSKLYEKCANKVPVILVLQTTMNRRFGFYSDLQIKSDYQYVEQNPNNCFLFSLDLQKKFTSNEQNCKHVMFSRAGYFCLGQDYDIKLCTNSNANATSFNGFASYGKNDGGGYAYLAGTYNFTNLEIEVFQVQSN